MSRDMHIDRSYTKPDGQIIFSLQKRIYYMNVRPKAHRDE